MWRKHFSNEDEERLVTEVKKRPILYDPAHPKHKDITTRDRVWREIGSTLGKNFEECKKRWRNIRDTYNRLRRKNTRSANTSNTKWSLVESVSFLNGVEKTQSFSNTNTVDPLQIENEVENFFDEDVDDDNMSAASSHHATINQNNYNEGEKLIGSNSRKRPPSRTESVDNFFGREQKVAKLLATQEDDDVDLFFKSLAKTVKKFPRIGINEAKLELLCVVNELEEKYSAEIVDLEQQNR